MSAWWQRSRHVSLATRIVLVMLVVLSVVQAAGWVVVRGTMDRQLRTSIAAELRLGERVWQRLLEQHAQRLREGSALLASDFGFRSAVASGDRATIDSALDNSSQRIRASMAALLDPAFRLTNFSGANAPMVSSALQSVAAQLATDQDVGRVGYVRRQPYLFVMVPVKAPAVVGWVMMGFPLNQSLVDDFHRLSGVHVTILSQVGAAPSDVVLSTLTPSAARAIEASGETMVAHRVPLDVIGGDVQLVFTRAVAEAKAPYLQLQWKLGLITAGGVLLFAFASHLAVRRVTRPLKDLTDATEVMEQGQFDVHVMGTQRQDEVGALARGFDRMRSSLSQQRQQILRLAYWDRLTGLPNRERFRDAIKAAIEERRPSARPLCVVTINLDRFKHVNDVLGYAFGDELLKAVALRLQQQLPQADDLVARLGGDEFAFLLHHADAQGAMHVTARIAKAFEEPLPLGDQSVDLSASMGVASWPDDGDDADAVMNRSEIAMHAAKASTAGALRYAATLDSSSAQTLSLLSDLRRALQNEEFRLFLQPKLDTATGQVCAAEALVRWQHPTRGLVPPMDFIPFAEQTGFVRQLTLWVFEEAARQWAALQPGQGHLRLAINLSTRDLMDVELPSRLTALMSRFGVKADSFCLEITESAIMDDPRRAGLTLNRLAELGFKLSIDDFGTGYSSLAYLKCLPVHELKIDKSFVMGMATDVSDEKIVRSTIDLAHNLGLLVVAEGVEDAATLARLREWHCDEVQGYFVSKPMPVDRFASWRASWESDAANG